MSKIYRYPLTIRETHLDTFGHVNNATYLVLFEDARWDLITKNGIGLTEVQRTGIGPVILKLTVEFRKELKVRQNVFIETQMKSSSKKIFVLQQQIKDEENTLYSEAEFTIGLFDLKARKLVNLTEDWCRVLGVETPPRI